jgi:hypothetical protein
MCRRAPALFTVLVLAAAARAAPEARPQPEPCNVGSGGQCRELLDRYRWLAADAHVERLDDRIPPPRGGASRHRRRR